VQKLQILCNTEVLTLWRQPAFRDFQEKKTP